MLAVAYSILVLGSHHPSDVVGGHADGRGLDRRRRGRARRRGAALALGPPTAPGFGASRRALWLTSGAAAVAVLAALVLGAAASQPGVYPTLLVGAMVLAACAAVIPAAAATLLGR